MKILFYYLKNFENGRIIYLSSEGNTNSTYDNSKSLGVSQNTENIFHETQEKNLNSLRAILCIKNKLYEIILNPNLDEINSVYTYQK